MPSPTTTPGRARPASPGRSGTSPCSPSPHMASACPSWSPTDGAPGSPRSRRRRSPPSVCRQSSSSSATTTCPASSSSAPRGFWCRGTRCVRPPRRTGEPASATVTAWCSSRPPRRRSRWPTSSTTSPSDPPPWWLRSTPRTRSRPACRPPGPSSSWPSRRVPPSWSSTGTRRPSTTSWCRPPSSTGREYGSGPFRCSTSSGWGSCRSVSSSG